MARKLPGTMYRAPTRATRKWARRTGLHRREIPRRISRARLTVDSGALPCVRALRAKPKRRDTPLPSFVRAGGMTAQAMWSAGVPCCARDDTTRVAAFSSGWDGGGATRWIVRRLGRWRGGGLRPSAGRLVAGLRVNLVG